MNENNLGLIIKQLRKKKNLTQEQLSHGICSVSQLYRIENGKHSPSTLLLHQLSIKLSEDLSKYFIYSNCRNPLYFSSLFNKLESLRLKRRYNEILSIISDLEMLDKYKYDLSLPNIKQLVGWYKGMAISNITPNIIDATYYKNLLVLTTNYENLDKLFDGFLSDNEIKLLHSIATSYCRSSNYSYAKFLILSLLDNISRNSIEINNIIKAEMYYNLSKILYIEKDYNNSIIYANTGIEICTRNNFSSVLSDLYYTIGKCHESLGNIDSAIDYFTKFIFLYDIFGHDKFSSKAKAELVNKYKL